MEIPFQKIEAGILELSAKLNMILSSTFVNALVINSGKTQYDKIMFCRWYVALSDTYIKIGDLPIE